tara:strand:+ start:3955 stop:4815 length:861 start_codon:yes stop_codon:yes gene_type:complete
MAITSDFLAIYSGLFTASFGTIYQAEGKLRKTIHASRVFHNVHDSNLNISRAGAVNMVPLTSFQSDIASGNIDVQNINMTFSPKVRKDALGEYELVNFRPDVVPTLAYDHALAVTRYEDNEIIKGLTAGKSATIADGGTNMTTDKLVEARYMLGQNNVSGMLHLVMTWSQYKSMLGEIQFTDSSFSSGQALVNPGVSQAMFAGFNITILGNVMDGATNLGLPKTGDIRKCYAFSDTSMLLAYQKETATRVVHIPQNLRMEVITAASISSKAYDSLGIIEIDCDETA